MTRLKYESIPIKESGEKLLDLSNFNFVLDPQYFKQDLTKTPKMYLRESAVQKLLDIQKSLGKYKFKIWDGYRPREVQLAIYERFWNELKAKNPTWDEEKLKHEVTTFVTLPTDPRRIPPHSAGGTVDLTLVDQGGDELNMGTGFDHFGPEAFAFYYDENDIDEEVRSNRKLLRESMVEAGFRMDPDEWWHYDFGNQLWAFDLGKTFAIYGEIKKT